MAARLVVYVIRYVTVADVCYCFLQGEGSTLTCAINRGLVPSIEQMHPLVAFAMLARVIGMHDDTVGAAINLRGADFNEIEQFLLKPLAWT
jgi:hypothetical protein